MIKMKKLLFASLLSSLLAGCSNFFDKDNMPTPAPLVNFTPEVRVYSPWSVRTGSGVGKDYLKLVPAVTGEFVFTADKNGTVTATNKSNGRKIWSVNSGILVSAGPTAGHDTVLVGSREGDLEALSQTTGNLLWKARASSEILAKPAAHNGIVVIKAIDGKLSAFDENTGNVLWHYQQTEPALILRGASAPQIQRNTIVAGFANGNLAKLTLDGGNLQWQSTIAIPEGSFAIQRMIDIDADPIIFNDHVYVATYQGRIAAIDLISGREKWYRELSSYTGMTVNDEKVYVSDAKSFIWAFDANTGKVAWQQQQLEARNVTAPVIMGNYLVVGDAQGYLHWLSLSDGHLAARTRVNKSPILAAPVVDHDVLYVVTTDGYLATYTIG